MKSGRGRFAEVLDVGKGLVQKRLLSNDHTFKLRLLNEANIYKTLSETRCPGVPIMTHPDMKNGTITLTKMDGDIHDLWYSGEDRCPNVREVIFEVGEIVLQLHQRGIMHLDIKPENVLYKRNKKEEMSLEVCDFGMSSFAPRLMRSAKCGTPELLPPEVVGSGKVSFAADVWNMGKMMEELLNDRDEGRECAELIALATEEDHLERIDMEQFLKHPYFAGLKRKYADFEPKKEEQAEGELPTCAIAFAETFDFHPRLIANLHRVFDLKPSSVAAALMVAAWLSEHRCIKVKQFASWYKLCVDEKFSPSGLRGNMIELVDELWAK
jgi:serine/threonine protein kinase